MAGVLSTTKGIFASTQQSGSVGSALSTFSRFKICFTSTPLTCQQGQVNKISLIQFNAHRNWYTVNASNSKVYVRYLKGGSSTELKESFDLEHKDYASIGDVAAEFTIKMKALLTSAALQGGAFGEPANVVPAAGQRTGQTGKRSLSFDITSTGTLVLSSIRVQFPQFRKSEGNPPGFNEDGTLIADNDFSDSYVLLGGKRVTDPNDLITNSMKVDIVGNKITFAAPFPMVLQTQPYMYLSLNISNDNLQTANLGNVGADISEHVTSSCFLGKIPVQNEYCAIQLDESTPYHMTTNQRIVTSLLFQCLDSHGRAFAFINDTGEAGNDIETQGNLFSDMVIRHEVLDIGPDGNVLDAPFKTYNYQLNSVGTPQLIGGGGF
tara:strand:- start:872 stop:2008 length:1137 start_codon:yes stop_codon:yes gene_type:complete